MIRPARGGDAAAIAALQSRLDAPSPRLLATVGAVGTCLVAVGGTDVAEGAGAVNEVSDIDEAGAVDGVSDVDGASAGDGRPVGYVLVIGEGDAHLAELVVHPDHRRRGHGRALVEAVIDRQAPGTRVTLAVAADNDPARSLYESVGFEPIDRRPGFYESVDGCPDEAVVYAYDVPKDGD